MNCPIRLTSDYGWAAVKLIPRRCRSGVSSGQLVKKTFPRVVQDDTIGLRCRGWRDRGETNEESSCACDFVGNCVGGYRGGKEPGGAFPEGYRSWQHVKSVVIGPEHKSFASEGGKIFHFYANPQAVEGYRTGRFPNGSVIVRETLRTKAGEGESKGTLTEGERSAVDVMTKDDQPYRESGGWGFETFVVRTSGWPKRIGRNAITATPGKRITIRLQQPAGAGRYWHAVSGRISGLDFPPQFDGSGDLRRVAKKPAKSHARPEYFISMRTIGDGRFALGFVSGWSNHCRRDAGMAVPFERQL